MRDDNYVKSEKYVQITVFYPSCYTYILEKVKTKTYINYNGTKYTNKYNLLPDTDVSIETNNFKTGDDHPLN